MRYILPLTFLLGHVFAKAEFFPSGPELDLVLRRIGDFDLDLVRVEERGDEDVIYLRRRAEGGEGCKENDCATFKAWAIENGEEEELKESETDTEEDVTARDIDPPHRLARRGKPKPATICKHTKIDGKTTEETEIKFESYAYPSNKQVEKNKYVYDFEDFDQPNTIEWFKVKNIESRVPNREYVVEHILEWQMYLRFLMGKKGKTNKENEEKPSKNDDDDDDEVEDPELCEVLHKYWKGKIQFEVEQPVKQGKAWLPSTTKTKLDETPLEYIGHQYPGGVTKSPYTDEFVILEHEMNSRKEHLWMGNNLSPFLNLADGKPSQNNKENYKTMQFNLEHNKWWDNKDKGNENKDAKENEGKCQGIGKFRDVLGVYQYHQDSHVEDIMKKQIKRIEQAFKTMEEDILPKQSFTDSNGQPRPAYVSQDLAKKWKEFMKEEFDHRIKKIEEWMEKWAKVFEDMKDGKGVSDLGKMFQKRAQTYTNLCGTAVDDEVIDRIEKLLEMYKDKGTWKNPVDW